MNSACFEECILLAANIGNDADTTAAISGQIAGAFYGLSGIPEKWRSRIAMGQMIEELALKLLMAEEAGVEQSFNTSIYQ